MLLNEWQCFKLGQKCSFWLTTPKLYLVVSGTSSRVSIFIATLSSQILTSTFSSHLISIRPHGRLDATYHWSPVSDVKWKYRGISSERERKSEWDGGLTESMQHLKMNNIANTLENPEGDEVSSLQQISFKSIFPSFSDTISSFHSVSLSFDSLTETKPLDLNLKACLSKMIWQWLCSFIPRGLCQSKSHKWNPFSALPP